MKYIAKPIVVNARRITAFEPVEVRGVLDFIGNAGMWLHLDDGSKYKAAPSQLAMFTPQDGDYLVQDTDYEYLCPRIVFERNFTDAEGFIHFVDTVKKLQETESVEVVEAVSSVNDAFAHVERS